MTMETTWLPGETLQRRRQLQRVLLSRREKPGRFHFSEFLTARHVLFLEGGQSRIEAVEALIGTLSLQDPRSALQAIWTRERQSALMIGPDVAILRGRLEGMHHMRVALGLCPKGIANPSYPHARTRILVVLAGPAGQTHLHMNLLTSLSELFRRSGLTGKLLGSNSSEEVLQVLQKAEGRCVETHGVRRIFQNIREFMDRHYGGGGD